LDVAKFISITIIIIIIINYSYCFVALKIPSLPILALKYHNIIILNRSFGNVSQFKYSETKVTN
jgi:hypothetical protein